MSAANVCEKQIARFLKMLEEMSVESQQSFQRIYRLAPNDTATSPSVGKHVRLAMMEAVRHPGIAYWVRMNLAIRVALKFSQLTGREDKAHRLTELLEAFHVAADVFILKISVERAIQRRANQRRWKNILPLLPQRAEMAVGWVSDEELAQIQQFKRKIIPGFVGAIRQKHQSMQEPDWGFMDG